VLLSTFASDRQVSMFRSERGTCTCLSFWERWRRGMIAGGPIGDRVGGRSWIGVRSCVLLRLRCCCRGRICFGTAVFDCSPSAWILASTRRLWFTRAVVPGRCSRDPQERSSDRVRCRRELARRLACWLTQPKVPISAYQGLRVSAGDRTVDGSFSPQRAVGLCLKALKNVELQTRRIISSSVPSRDPPFYSSYSGGAA
jgi:hypothetical protein